jgi:hypothetical protein
MVPASKNIEKLAETAAVYLGRSPTEKGVDRLMADLSNRGDTKAGDLVRLSDLKGHEKLLAVAKLIAGAAKATGDGFSVPAYMMGALDTAITEVDPTAEVWTPARQPGASL